MLNVFFRRKVVMGPRIQVGGLSLIGRKDGSSTRKGMMAMMDGWLNGWTDGWTDSIELT